jgi:CheY-like chemotaxis protein/HPt (histidine-containing phosphotransfer) domain-containing protein
MVSDHPGIRALPVVLMSSDSPSLPAAAQEAGIVATLTKPIQQSQLYDCFIHVAAARTNTAPAGPNSTAEPLPSEPAGDVRLLLAEDNETNQIVALGILHELGYQVDVANDGVQALALMDRHTYDAVLMDCQMPNMDGYQTACEIRRREAQFHKPGEPADAGSSRRIPIIAITAAALKEDRDRCHAAGIDDYLTKPFEPEDLNAALNRWISDAEPTRQPHGAMPADTPIAADTSTTVRSTTLERAIVERLDRLRDHVPAATVDRLLSSFVDDGRRCVADLDTALAHTDTDRLSRTAHTFKGIGAAIGAKGIVSLCELVEESVTGNQIHDLPTILARLSDEYAHIEDVLQIIHPAQN